MTRYRAREATRARGLGGITASRRFPERVRRAPERFGIGPERVSERVAEVERVLSASLAASAFSYRRSDGSVQKLSLANLVERAERLEMAYNPNDCVELRWGAEPGSAEASTCQRHAPEEQRARMQSYRPWFATRKRPPR